MGGEGIISKKAGAPYRDGRTRDWLKIKCIQRQEFVIVGWSESDKRRGFRSLLLAVQGQGQAHLCRQGRHRLQREADRGSDGADGAARNRQGRRSRSRAPDRKGAHWIEPKLVAEIAFSEFTDDGVLRHPSFIALREDKPAKEVVREVPKHTESVTKPPNGSPPQRPRRRTRPRRTSGSKSAVRNA